jgi:hypothetical protein
MVLHEECSGLDDLRNKYNDFKERYNLPEFSDLNRLFDVEEIDSDTEFLLRRIRRVISEKIAGYLRFVEIVLNPSNAPMFFFKLIKKLEEEDKVVLTEIYETLGKFEFELIALDISYSEEKEVEFIKKIFNIFERDIGVKLLKIIEKMGNGENGVRSGNNGGYVG